MSSEMIIELWGRVVGRSQPHGELSPGDLPSPPVPESFTCDPGGLV